MKKRIEPIFHGLPLLYLIGTNIFLLSKQSFNLVEMLCLISPYPTGCDLNPDVTCTRGEHSKEYTWYLFGWPMIILFVVIVLAMGRLYYAVRALEIKMRKYQLSIDALPDGVASLRRRVELRQASDTIPEPPPDVSSRQQILMRFMPSYNPTERRSDGTRQASSRSYTTPRTPGRTSLAQKRRETMIQCFLYVCAYFMYNVFRIAASASMKSGKVVYPLWILAVIFSPLQGFFNFMVFIRPRVLGFREADSELSFRQAFLKAILSTSTTTAAAIRRRSSLMNTQANGGQLYTAREFDMYASSRNKENTHVIKHNENTKMAITQAVEELRDLSFSDEEEVT